MWQCATWLGRYQCSGGIYCPHLQLLSWRWKQLCSSMTVVPIYHTTLHNITEPQIPTVCVLHSKHGGHIVNLLTIWWRCGRSICSFSAGNKLTLPNTSLKSFRYRLLRSTLLPISSIRSSRYSTSTVAKIGDVVGFDRNELPTICSVKLR